jgi:hypothetical protein
MEYINDLSNEPPKEEKTAEKKALAPLPLNKLSMAEMKRKS